MVSEHNWLAERFEENRNHLRSVAYRMLGSLPEADDAVQEAWLRFSRSDTRDVQNLGGWLTTVVARVSLDMLRSRKSRREDALEEGGTEPEIHEGKLNPEGEVLLADSIGLALLVVLEMLTPAERVAFVLHDMFDIPFEEIAPIVGRSEMATRQLASRARRRVQGTDQVREASLARRKRVVDAFLAAARNGDFEALLALLDPEVVVRADGAARARGAAGEVRGSTEVAGTFLKRSRGARPAMVGGMAGLVWAPGGQIKVAFNFSIVDDRIVGIDLIGEPDSIRQLGATIVDA